MAQPNADTAKLLVKIHGQGSRTIDLSMDCFTIGRKADNSLPIEDHTVSGHHARIVKIQSVYFLEDLKSTNGTSVNDRRIDRHQLRDADVITIGQHRIIFQEPSALIAVSQTPADDLDKTMVIGNKAAAHTQEAKMLVKAGKTDRNEYRLTKPVSLIGSQEGAAIRLTGWFAPKTAAQISRRGGNYVITPSQGTKSLLVNGREVTEQEQLKNGDEIQIAGVTLTFYQLPNAA